MSPSALDVLILCGGLGSRLRPIVSDRPKVLAPVGGRPFMDILVDDLLQQGFRRVIFCVGHLKDHIIEHYNTRTDAEYLFSEEETPLGTGGAVQNALPLVRSNPFIVMNGDSLCSVEFEKLASFHHAKESTLSLVLARADGKSDGGVVRVDQSQRVMSFLEKQEANRGGRDLINAGIYALQRECFEVRGMPQQYSLEYDLFPELVAKKPCYGFIVASEVTDIGVPERYWKANNNGIS